MVPTQAFAQLVQTPASKIRSEYAYKPRICLPTKIRTLESFGLESAHIELLKSVVSVDADESKVVAGFLFALFGNERFAAKSALKQWLQRKGGISDEQAKACAKAAELIKRNELTNERCFKRVGNTD